MTDETPPKPLDFGTREPWIKLPGPVKALDVVDDKLFVTLEDGRLINMSDMLKGGTAH